MTNFIKKHKWGLLLFVPILLILFPLNIFLFVLIQSMGTQIMLGYALVSIAFLLRKQMPLSLITLSATLILFVFYAPYIKHYNRDNTFENGLKIAHYNVLQYNNHFQETIKSAKGSGADFISFQETDQLWANELRSGLAKEYPYFHFARQSSGFGACVLSKTPISHLKVFYWEGKPNITGQINTVEGQVNFITSHTKSPIRQSRFKARNRQIVKMAEFLKRSPQNTIAIGDFNTVPWDIALKNLLSTTNMTDSRSTYAGTYPSWFPKLNLPIDYILHTQDIECGYFKLLKDTSSDHYGILGTYRIKKPPFVS